MPSNQAPATCNTLSMALTLSGGVGLVLASVGLVPLMLSEASVATPTHAAGVAPDRYVASDQLSPAFPAGTAASVSTAAPTATIETEPALNPETPRREDADTTGGFLAHLAIDHAAEPGVATSPEAAAAPEAAVQPAASGTQADARPARVSFTARASAGSPGPAGVAGAGSTAGATAPETTGGGTGDVPTGSSGVSAEPVSAGASPAAPTVEETPAPPTPSEYPLLGDHRIFDGTLAQPRPEWDDLPIEPMFIVYAHTIGINTHTMIMPDDEFLIKKINRLPDAEIYCLDIEHLPVVIKDPQEVAKNIAHLSRVVRLFRQEKPGAKIGFFGIFPRATYAESWSTSTLRNNAMALNDGAKPLADQVDIIFPSLYRFDLGIGREPTPSEWRLRAEFLISESRRYGKPVYGFLMAKPGEDEEQDWPLQLEVVRQHADATVMWSGPIAWSRDEAWWKETVAYVEGLKRSVDASYD